MKIKIKKNYIAGVAKLLGVEEGEVFQVNGDTSLEKCFLCSQMDFCIYLIMVKMTLGVLQMIVY